MGKRSPEETPDYGSDQPTVFQGTALGKPFNRFTTTLPDGTRYRQSRRVKVSLSWDERTGDLKPEAYQLGEHPLMEDFPLTTLKEAMRLREQMVGRDIVTVCKHGASQKYLEVDPNRGRPELQIKKPSNSFFLYPGGPDQDHPQIPKKN